MNWTRCARMREPAGQNCRCTRGAVSTSRRCCGRTAIHEPGVDARHAGRDQRLLRQAGAQHRPPDRAGRDANAAGHARKTERDEFWNELLVIWCDIGGKSQRHGGGEIPDRCVEAGDGAGATITTVVQWLGRRQNKTARPKSVSRESAAAPPPTQPALPARRKYLYKRASFFA